MFVFIRKALDLGASETNNVDQLEDRAFSRAHFGDRSVRVGRSQARSSSSDDDPAGSPCGLRPEARLDAHSGAPAGQHIAVWI